MKGWHWLLLLGLAAAAAVSGGMAVQSTSLIQRIANAIATAEGFFIAGSLPNRRNNPGDLKSGGIITTYPTAQDGWNALYTQVDLMLNGGSAYYNPSMTIRQIGYIYADGVDDPMGAESWAQNVAANLGVSADTPLNALT